MADGVDSASKLDRRAGRTTIRLSAMAELEAMAKRLNAHMVRHGTVVIGRTGSKRSDELAEWAFNLLDTYRKSPQGRRPQWVRAQLPHLHEAMLAWAGEPGTAAAIVASRRFEVQAAMAFGFMVRFQRAPKQNAACVDEARLAKWLSRRRPTLGRVPGEGPDSVDVLQRLQAACQALRKADGGTGFSISYSDPLFGLIANQWLAKCSPGPADATTRIRTCVSERAPFWVWPQWMNRLQAVEDLRRQALSHNT